MKNETTQSKIDKLKLELEKLEVQRAKELDELKKQVFIPSYTNIINLFREQGVDIHDMNHKGDAFIYGEWRFTCIDRHGGCEGAGEEHYIVLELTQNEKTHSYWKIDGWYTSYDGATLELSGIYQVNPKNKVIQVWE